MNPLASAVTAGRFHLRAELAGLCTVRSLRWAVLLMVLGGVLWVRQLRPTPALEASTGSAPAALTSVPTDGSVGTPSRSPATFRLGAGYAGGFLLGFLFRRFLKVTSVVVALLLAAVAEGYLPSTAATGWGLWRGLRRKTERIAAPPA